MGRTVWLCRVETAGRLFLSASESVAPVATRASVHYGAGASLTHPAGISDLRVEESVDLGDYEGQGVQEASVTTYLDPSPATLAAGGWRMGDAVCELSLWQVGTAYESREVIFRGRVEPDAVVERGRPVSLTLLPDPLDQGSVYPPTTAAIVKGQTWTSPTDAVENEGYPFVFGAPGVYVSSTGAASRTSGSPVYVVTETAGSQVGLIAGHKVAASTVRVYTVPEATSATFSVTHQEDGRGRYVATVDLSSKNGVWTLDDDAELYVTDWYSGGLLRTDGQGPVARAGDVLVHLLTAQGVKLDRAAWGAALPRLNAVRVDGYWRESVIPWTYISQEVLPLLPDTWILQGRYGARPVLLERCAAEHALALTVGQDVYRPDGGAPEYPPVDELGISRATVEYALRVRKDVLRGAVSLGWDRRRAETASAGSTLYGGAGYSRSGDVEVRTEAANLYRRGEAHSLAVRQLRSRWAPPVSDAFWAPLRKRALFPLGRAVVLTDSDRSYARRYAHVTGRALTLDRVEVMTQYRA